MVLELCRFAFYYVGPRLDIIVTRFTEGAGGLIRTVSDDSTSEQKS